MFKRALLLLLAVFLLPQNCLAAQTPERPGPRQVVLVVCDNLELDDLDASTLPNLYSFFTKGGVALLNTNTAGSRTRPDTAATVSAGRVALGAPQEILVYGINESYRDENPPGCVPGTHRYRSGAE